MSNTRSEQVDDLLDRFDLQAVYVLHRCLWLTKENSTRFFVLYCYGTACCLERHFVMARFAKYLLGELARAWPRRFSSFILISVILLLGKGCNRLLSFPTREIVYQIMRSVNLSVTR